MIIDLFVLDKNLALFLYQLPIWNLAIKSVNIREGIFDMERCQSG